MSNIRAQSFFNWPNNSKLFQYFVGWIPASRTSLLRFALAWTPRGNVLTNYIQYSLMRLGGNRYAPLVPSPTLEKPEALISHFYPPSKCMEVRCSQRSPFASPPFWRHRSPYSLSPSPLSLTLSRHSSIDMHGLVMSTSSY